MSSLDLIGAVVPTIIILAMCFFAFVIICIAVVAIIWGLRKGKVRVTANERNFDDFGR